MIFALVFSSVALVNANTALEYYEEQDENPYKYNALENKSSFVELQKDADTTEEAVKRRELERRIQGEWQSIIEKQNFSVGEIAKAVSALRDRNGMKTFLAGNNLSVLRFQLVQIKEIATLLNTLAKKTEDESTKIQIDNQIKFLRQEQKKVESFIFEQKNELSLFGWFVNML